MKKIIKVLLIITLMLLTLSVTALAETDDYYTYTVSNNKAVIIDVDTSISGVVTIPSTLGGYPVTAIGDNSFKYCDNLTSIVIPDSITVIGTASFEYCTNLTSVIIGDNVTIVGPAAFQYCEKLVTVVIPDSVTTIYKEAFNNCCNLTNLIMGRSVNSIGENAFSSCKSLTNVVIGYNTKSVGENAFSSCYNIKNVYYTDSETQWENISFNSGNGCLKEADIIYNNILHKTQELICVVQNNELTVICTNGIVSGEMNIPTFVGDYKTTAIGDKAFFSCSELTSVIIPESVTEIGEEVFFGCSGIEKITTPFIRGHLGNLFGSCQYNGSYEAGNLSEIYYIPSKLKKVFITNEERISYGAFYNCSNLTDIEIGDNVTEIEDGAFYNCNKLTSIVMGDKVTKIGALAFYNCTKLANIVIGNSVAEIGERAFKGCSGLKRIIIPNSVTKIGENVLCGCSALEELTIPFVGSERGNSGTADALFGYIFGTSSYTNSYAVEQKYNSNEHVTYYIPTSLSKVTVTDEKVIPYGAFSSCNHICDIVIEGKPTAIMANSFTGFYNLFNVVVKAENVRYVSSNIFEGSDFPTMYGYVGSTTESYAKEYNVEFVPLDYYEEYTLSGNAKNVNGKIVVNVKVSDKVKDKHLHIALYDDNEKQIDYMIVPTQDAFDEINVVFADNKSAKTAKMFLWESLVSLTPISASVETEIIR